MSGDASPPSPVPQSASDLLAVYENVAGNVTREAYYGGDLQSVGTGGLCGVALPAVPAYDLRHTYSNGVRATSQYYSGGAPILFKSLDRTIDLSGTVVAERDGAGFATAYAFYPWGGLRTVTLPGELPVTYTYALATKDAWNRLVPASVTATRGDEERIQLFDVLGRPFRESVLMPDGRRSTSEVRFDAAGRKELVSGFESLDVPAGGTPPANPLDYHPIHTTHFTYDIFDRPVSIATPDQKTTTFSYVGASAKRSTIGIFTGGTSDTPVTTSANYDHLGRLISVQEARGTTSSTITSYSYDVGDRLVSVVQPTDTGGNQFRSFAYDNRGFLLTETHPELGSGGNGSVAYEEYDARGHAHRRMIGDRYGAFDVRTSFDAAERPETVTRATAPTPQGGDPILKQFAYDQGYDCGAGLNCRGKLAAAVRYNFSPGLGTVAVTETYEYNGVRGRPSRRYRTVGDALPAFAGNRFLFDETYDDRGRPATIIYPCRAQANYCTGAEPFRRVTYQYAGGFLTAVSPWATALTYQPNGSLDTVTHASGFLREVWTPDPYGLNRPNTIRAVDASDVTQWTSGQYLYDGAGNITQIGSRSYRYDLFNRLSSESDGGLAIGYQYDKVGNLKEQTTTIFAAPTPVPGTSGGGTFSRAINRVAIDSATNHLTYGTYDMAGNATSAGSKTLTYDALGTTTSITVDGRSFQFLYTPDEERIAAVELRNTGNRTTWTLRGFENQLLRTWRDEFSNGTSIQWREDEIRRGPLLLASETPAGTRHYALDHLGSPRLISDATGMHSQYFSAFGGGGTLDGGSLQFTGHERDAAALGDGKVDLPDYMHARFYDVSEARFLSLDPTWSSADLGTPQSWNRYSYVGNNPVGRFDPDGRCGWGWLLGAAGCVAEDTIRGVVSDAHSVHEALSGMGTSASTSENLMGAGVIGLVAAKYGAAALAPGEAAAGEEATGTVSAVVEETTGEAASPTARGRASEARVLESMGMKKNTEVVSSEKGRSIPDGMDDTKVVEVKDTKKVADTRQMQIQRDVANSTNREHVVVTGTNTKVSKPLENNSTVIRRDDLGPQQQ